MSRQNLIEWNERQKVVAAEARKLADDGELDLNGDKPEEKEASEKYDRYMAEFDELDKKIEREKKLIDAEERAEQTERRLAEPDNPENRPEPEDVGDDETETRNTPYSLDDETVQRMYKAFLSDGLDSVLIRDEKDEENYAKFLKEDKLRAQTTGTAASGGVLIPEGYMPEIIKGLKMWGPMYDDDGPCRILPTNDGRTIPWPTLDNTSDVGEAKAENTDATETTFDDFNEVELQAYKYSGKMVKVPRELLQDSFFMENAFHMFFAELLTEALGRTLNEVLTTGDGASKPQGVVTGTGTTAGVTTASNATITELECIDVQHSIDPAYRMHPGVCWMFHDDTLKILRKIQDGDGRFHWQPNDLKTGEPAMFLGKKYAINQAMDQFGANSRKPIIYGDLKRHVVRKVRSMGVRRLDERFAEADQVAYILFARVDGHTLDSRAIKHVATS